MKLLQNSSIKINNKTKIKELFCRSTKHLKVSRLLMVDIFAS